MHHIVILFVCQGKNETKIRAFLQIFLFCLIFLALTRGFQRVKSKPLLVHQIVISFIC